ncbi:hypothetical protein [Aquimarina sp. 2201CG5-10]|nr:hypothetical protein [Aquimarina sp. 2201CG5-10]MDY8135391.1 hypothetical protein [Aquimarina sp. 2201CG5-10]
MIAKANNPDRLAEEVQSRIEEGWIPQGGVCVANASNYILTQALILKTE